MRQSGYLFLAGLLLLGGGMTTALTVFMPPVQQQSAEPAPETREQPLAANSPAPILQNEHAAAKSEPPASPMPEPPIEASAPAMAEVPAAPEPALPIASTPAAPEPAPVAASAPAPETHADLPAAPPPPAPVASPEPAASSTKLAALTPPEAVTVAPARPEPVSLGSLTPNPEVPLPRMRPPDPGPEANALAADLFAHVKSASAGAAHVVGFYSAGCIAGAQPLALEGPGWQVMRPSRNRNWGHPELIAFIERLARKVVAHTDWPGILIGDMAQPRGGPLPAGHASHQVGLDVDIWLKPMPKEPYTPAQADTVPMVSVVAPDNKQLDKAAWRSEDASLIKIAAEQPEVERIFVNPVIKKELCRTKTAADESWMQKVRPWYGHDEHIHVRLKCPPGSPECREQPSVPDGDGCGKGLEHWFTAGILAVTERIRTRAPVKRTTTMRALPRECVAVLHAPDATNQVATTGR